MRSRRALLAAGAVAGILLLVGIVAAPVWLRAVGDALVDEDEPRPADAALVLAGDAAGNRILKACELVRKRLVPRVLVSGPKDLSWYGTNEADAAIRFVGAEGCDASLFEPVYLHAFSTLEEAQAFAPELRRRSLRSVLIVTSDYHTARAGRIFRRELRGDIQIFMIGAPDRDFSAASWWQRREGQKRVFYEVSKTVAEWLGL